MNLNFMLACVSAWFYLLVPIMTFASFFHTTLFPIKVVGTDSQENCFDPIQEFSLRAWLDPLQNQEGGLRSDQSEAMSQIQSNNTHVLSVELSLINPSLQRHIARVLSASWRQADVSDHFTWNLQPDLSPLNRFKHTQQLLLSLQPDQPVEVQLMLEFNGAVCMLKAQAVP